MRVETSVGGLTLRDADKSDSTTILEFIRALARYERMENEVSATEEKLMETLFGRNRRAKVVIAEMDGHPAGFALYFYNYSTFLAAPGIYLEDLFVSPKFRKRAVGHALMTYLARKAVQEGCGRFEWSALDWNTPAIEFYRSHGARPLSDWTVFRVDGDALEQLAAAFPGKTDGNAVGTVGQRPDESIITPGEQLEYIARRTRRAVPVCPSDVIVCYQSSLWKWVRNTYETADAGIAGLARCTLPRPALGPGGTGGSGGPAGPPGSASTIDANTAPSTAQVDRFGVLSEFGFGGPAVVALVETAVAAGAHRIINLGTAGAVDPSLSIGDVVVCDEAARDEGTSDHYLPPGDWVCGSRALGDRIHAALLQAGIRCRRGRTWTTDAPFRESRTKLLRYRRDGVLTVEMEAASVFSVSQFRSVETCAVFVVSDRISDGTWEPGFHMRSVRNALRTCFGIIADTLARTPAL